MFSTNIALRFFYLKIPISSFITHRMAIISFSTAPRQFSQLYNFLLQFHQISREFLILRVIRESLLALSITWRAENEEQNCKSSSDSKVSRSHLILCYMKVNVISSECIDEKNWMLNIDYENCSNS